MTSTESANDDPYSMDHMLHVVNGRRIPAVPAELAGEVTILPFSRIAVGSDVLNRHRAGR